MALQLIIGTITQSKDASTITVPDATGVYDADSNATGWGTPNTEVTELDGITTQLTLQITVTTSDGTETAYDAINFFQHNGFIAPTSVTDLVFVLNPSHLLSGGIAMGDEDDQFVDGWYVFTYTINHDEDLGGGSSYTTSTYKLIDGIVRGDIYNTFLNVPYHTILSFKNRLYTPNTHDIYFPLYLAALFEGMNANVDESRKAEVLGHLQTLEDLTT